MYRECASKDTEIVLTPISNAPASTDSRYEEALAGPHIIAEAHKLAARQLSALIIGCFSDPIVPALREIFDFPVVGPGEASMLTASMLGDKISVVTILDNDVSMIEDVARRIGLGNRVVSVRSINIEPKELDRDPKRTEAATLEEARRAIEDDHASVLAIGCNSPEMASLADRLNKSLPIPVVNPARAAVNIAEALARQGLRNSRVTYRSPISVKNISYPTALLSHE
jgi:allantoin racemase